MFSCHQLPRSDRHVHPNMIKATKDITTIATKNGPVIVGYVTKASQRQIIILSQLSKDVKSVALMYVPSLLPRPAAPDPPMWLSLKYSSLNYRTN